VPRAADEEAIRIRIERLRLHSNRWIGYAVPTSPAAIIFLEEMQKHQWETHIVLPFPQDQLQQKLMQEWTKGSRWSERLGHVLRGAAKVHRLYGDNTMDEGTCLKFANRILEGLAILKSQMLQTERIDLTPPADNRGPGEILTALPSFPLHIRAMVFADVKGYSTLTDRQLSLFSLHYLGCISEVVQAHASGLLSTRTAGDGLFCVFADIDRALAFSLDLRDKLKLGHWELWGLPAQMGIRISLDAGPVYCYDDSIVKRVEFSGSYVNRAARIEPITPPGQVYASETLAALAAAQHAEDISFEYVGQVPLAKQYGIHPIYHVMRRHEPICGEGVFSIETD
jgi:class 3 adenylate cyclase